MKPPKIRWVRVGPNVAVGYAGKIPTFEVAKISKGYELTCELPSLNDRIFGRSITRHSTVKDAAKAADMSLEHWLRRLFDHA